MFNISIFLQKFVNIRNDNSLKLSIVSNVIKKETGIDFPVEKFEVNGDKLKIDCNPVFKNEIFMHKENIERNLKSQNIFLNII